MGYVLGSTLTLRSLIISPNSRPLFLTHSHHQLPAHRRVVVLRAETTVSLVGLQSALYVPHSPSSTATAGPLMAPGKADVAVFWDLGAWLFAFMGGLRAHLEVTFRICRPSRQSRQRDL